jgi:hypothetical protein
MLSREEIEMKLKRVVYGVLVVALGLALVACERVKIGDLNADPGRFVNKEVAVAGTVTQSIGALGKGIYQLDDGTGRLWILAGTRGVPSKGARVGVKGHIMPTVTFLGINYATVLEESDRRRG